MLLHTCRCGLTRRSTCSYALRAQAVYELGATHQTQLVKRTERRRSTKGNTAHRSAEKRSVRSSAAESEVIDVEGTEVDTRLPVTILTGFLGSGKTTLLNTVLSQDHGLRVAIIENEFGAIDIDSSLIRSKQSLDGVDVVESLNGCICCTVRADLCDALEKLVAARGRDFDHIVIETTGLADPRPIVSIFTTTRVGQEARLDGVVTLVDAKHVERHLDDAGGAAQGAVNEALQQIAYADRVVLNKTDLVAPADVDRVSQRIRKINGMAQIRPATNADVPLDYVLGIGGFDITRIPDEFAATSSQPDGSDVAAASDNGHHHHEEHHHHHEEHHHHHEEHHHHSDAAGGTDAYHSHSSGDAHGHRHDDTVSSVAFSVDGDLDLDMVPFAWTHYSVNDWLSSVLDYMSGDLFRYKGILAIEGVGQQYVFQGVHEQIQAVPGRDWAPSEKRRSQMVFIGRHIDDGLLQEGFEACSVRNRPQQQPAPV